MASDSDVNLARIAARVRGEDVGLHRMQALAEAGVGIELGVMVGGRTLYGQLAPFRTWAEHFDSKLDKALRVGSDAPENAEHVDTLKLLRDALAETPLTTLHDEQSRIEQEHEEKIKAAVGESNDWSFDDLPDELQIRQIEVNAPRSYYALRDVTIKGFAPLADFEVAFVRVASDRIDAWWIRNDRIERDPIF